MDGRAVVVRFSRGGSRESVPLSKATEYQISVNGTGYEPFRAPWDEDELDQVVTILRNESDQRANIQTLSEIGGRIGQSLAASASFVDAVRPDSDALTVYWHLDYPELARIPWEVACWWRPPHHHILLSPGVSFVRTVPLFDPGLHRGWPTGADKALQLLYVWGEHGQSVPHLEHLQALESACETGGVVLRSTEVGSAAELQKVYEEDPSDFVHILAHGAVASNGEWGLQLADEIAQGAQIARALRVGRTTPALVTLAACDSGNETDNSFGSVAYELHAHGLPMVLASQFRLRKSVSNTSVSRVYDGLLAGDHPLEVLAGVRNQLSSAGTEAWANEVLYTKYTLDELDHDATIATQQGALRRARALARKFADTPPDEEARTAATTELRRQIARLEELSTDRFTRAETFGLLGSIERQIAYLGAAEASPDEEALRDARDFYERGLKADMNNHYCGVNALHLSWLIGDQAKVAELQVIVDWAVQAALEEPDPGFWVHASAGEVKVYMGEAEAAAEHYREFVRGNRAANDPANQRDNVTAARRQMARLQARLSQLEPDDKITAVSAAAADATDILDSALTRI